MSCIEDASVSNCDAWDAGGVADKVMALATPTVPQGGLQLANRVILHIDLDCFYAQVEQKRLGIPRDVPCAVQQWNGLIAVNYAARAAGVTRHMRVAQAKQHCPELRLVHVQTIGCVQQPAAAPGTASTADADGASTATAAGSTAAAAAARSPAKPAGPAAAAGAAAAAAAAAAAGDGEAAAASGDVEGSALDRGSSKACLQRYRKASAQIMRLLGQLSPGCLLEKASIDEVYIDATPAAVAELAAAEGSNTAPATAADAHGHAGHDPEHDAGGAAAGSGGPGVAALLAAAAGASVVLGEGGLRPDNAYDRLAAAGAVIAARLRGQLLAQLGFTASAGIGPNKLLAKIGSAKNKPNQQTLLLPRAVEALMQDLPLGKVKGLGGKLGAALEALGAATAGAAAGLSYEALLAHFGPKARWVFNTVRGIDEEPVTPKDKVKSINSCKSFEPLSSLPPLQQWLGVLAAELAERMAEDEDEHARRPRSLVLQYRSAAPGLSGGSRGTPDRSIRSAMPPAASKDGVSADVIAAAALALFRRITPAPWPVVRLALVATEFVQQGGGGGSGAAMARFLAEQARILRDIEIQGMLQRNQQQQGRPTNTVGSSSRKRSPAGSSKGTQPAKKQAGRQQQQGGGKQRSISDLFGAQKK
ncbi:hypothetical protein OEZ85_006220 [Tetradesmus obliquus]|uniref:DNA polymerase eta n=1 Tax=Tetradesmus obliquus TaxID=3088 RepID=A0ABY8TUK5_TETOB|nr:hypothetical protein OEZ85_006220 [Tetradesmus obliquus]